MNVLRGRYLVIPIILGYVKFKRDDNSTQLHIHSRNVCLSRHMCFLTNIRSSVISLYAIIYGRQHICIPTWNVYVYIIYICLIVSQKYPSSYFYWIINYSKFDSNPITIISNKFGNNNHRLEFYFFKLKYVFHLIQNLSIYKYEFESWNSHVFVLIFFDCCVLSLLLEFEILIRIYIFQNILYLCRLLQIKNKFHSKNKK